jgi:hypothetical protein
VKTQHGGGATGVGGGAASASGSDADNVSWSSDDDMSSMHDDDDDDNDDGTNHAATSAVASTIDNNGNNINTTAIHNNNSNNNNNNTALPIDESNNNRAYWIQRTIREAIYGRVWMAIVLRRRHPSLSANDNAEWEVTDQFCAVKEMSWQHIRKERNRLAEDPIKEVSAMQFLKRWHSINATQQSLHNSPTATSPSQLTQSGALYGQSPHQPLADGVEESFRIILETNIMMPLDLLTDDRHLYSIMPYCNGGELFERLDMNERFSEPEARYWMYQVLNVSNISSYDVSRETLLCIDYSRLGASFLVSQHETQNQKRTVQCPSSQLPILQTYTFLFSFLN